MRSVVGLVWVCGASALLLGGCKEPPKYPPPVYIDYTKPAPTQPGPPQPTATAPGNATPPSAAQEGATIGDALAPFGIVLPPNISLLKLPPPSVWQNWPFTWPNLPAASTPQAGTPAPPPGGNPPIANAPGAAPATPPPSTPQPAGSAPPGWNSLEHDVLLETNRRRASGTRCGDQQLPPAPPLQASIELGRAARGHSEDMARQNYFDHTSLDGRSVEHRTRAAGFPGGFIGENIAAGKADARSTVQQWVDSPGHCLNMMEPRYRFLGVGYARSSTNRLTHFWTQNFGG